MAIKRKASINYWFYTLQIIIVQSRRYLKIQNEDVNSNWIMKNYILNSFLIILREEIGGVFFIIFLFMSWIIRSCNRNVHNNSLMRFFPSSKALSYSKISNQGELPFRPEKHIKTSITIITISCVRMFLNEKSCSLCGRR